MTILKHCLLRMVTNDSNKIVWPHFGWQKQLVCCSMAASCSFSSGTSTGGNAHKSRGGGSPRPKASSSSPLPHKYILAMFPYPSGRLHMGHLRVYALSDVLSRYYALKGHPVLHPIGWDAFGLPAENAARERGVDPAEWTQRNIEEMRAQLLRTGVRFNWDRELSTCHPDYFRWTQWLFLQLHSHGFVRKAWADVNWDPVDGTVLAEEQVSHDGRSWRSNALVERRRLRQWVVDTPRYAKRLLDGLAPLEFEWHEIARIQSDWIGPCDVFRFLLPVQQSSFASAASFPQQQPQTPQRPLQQTNLAQEGQWHDEQLDLRIADPAQLGAAQFVLLTRHHQIAQQARRQGGTLPDDAAGRGGGEEDFAILPDRWVSNFVTGRPMPLVVLLRERADEEPEEMEMEMEAAEMRENATASAATASSPPMPAFLMDCRLGHRHSGRPLDRAIADRLAALPGSTNSEKPNSKQLTATGDGQRQRGRRMNAVEVLRLAELLGLGGYQTSRKLRDWVVSRQRGWGTPIPMMLEEEQSPEGEGGIGGGGGGAVSPVHDEQLPILGEQRGQRMVNVPGCRFASGRLETDTLDTYFDSSWYFLRFLDPHNRDHACDPAIAHRQMPVNVYVGGVEHAQMHMFYARFISHFLYSCLGLLPQPEPFARFIALGMVRSRAYRVLSSGKYVPPSEVDGDPSSPNSFLIHRPTGQQVQVQFEKMSKSKHNGVDPIEMIDQYGADLTRLQLLFAARPNMNIDWPYPQPTYQIKNLRRWLSQVDSLVNNYVAIRSNSQEAITTAATDGDEPPTALPNGQQQQQQPSLLESTLRDIYNRHVKGVSMYLEVLRYHNTALIRLIDMTRALDKAWPTAAASTTTATASGGRQLQQQKQPIRHRGSAAELERCVHALVIMMQVFAPATAAEHWAKLQTLPAAHLQQSRPWWRPGAPLDGQRWPQLDPGDMVDFVLVTFGTIFSQQAPRADVEHLSDQQLERYARERTHARFFQRLEERQLRVQSSSVERLPGLCLVLRIKMAEDVRKRAITEIIQRYSKGSSSNDSADDGDGNDGIEDNNKMPRRRKKKAKKDGQQELGKEKEKAAMRMEGKEDENDENDDHGWEGKSSRSMKTSRKSRSEQG